MRLDQPYMTEAHMPVSIVMMALGLFQFGMNGSNYQTFRRAAAYRWQPLNRVGRTPAMQFMGPDTQEITLSGVIYPHFKGGLRQVELMRLAAAQGEPMILVDGLGWVWESWVVVSIEETKTLLMSDGAPRKIEFALTLQSYGADQ